MNIPIKYLYILSMSLKEVLTYRAELLLWSLIDAMPLIATLMLWLTAYDATTVIGGYNKGALISYYLLGYLINDLTGAYFEEKVIKDIRSGEISKHLLRPISLQISYIIGEIGWRLGTLVFTISPVFFFFFLFAREYFGIISFKYILFIGPIIIIAYLLDCLYSLLACAVGFVFEEANSLRHLKWMLLWLFSGGMMPFSFMPDWLAGLASLLPFQLKYFIPVSLLQGTIEFLPILKSLLLGILWLIILTLLLKIIWQRNLKKFTAVGS